MRKLAGILMLIMILTAVGCKNGQESDPKTAASVETEDHSEADKSTQEEKPPQDEVEIEIPDQQTLVTDYTSINGLKLETGAHIAVVVKNPKANYWKAVEKGIKQAVADLNIELGYEGADLIYYTFEGPEDGDAGVQINTIDAVLAENPQVLCLSAIDMNSCQAQLETAQENGIPVIILDSGVKSEELVYTICETDNYSAGAEAARKLCEAIGGTGKLQIIAHQQSAETSIRREQGFREEVAAYYPAVEVLETIYEDGEESVTDLMNRVLETHPDLKGCFTTSENLGVNALEILGKQNDRDVLMVGFDAGDTQLEAVRSGAAYGVICQNPYGMGYATIVAAARAVLGMENDSYIHAGYQWIDADNIDEEENQKYLYQ